jgi:type I restriction enzyme S subunit
VRQRLSRPSPALRRRAPLNAREERSPHAPEQKLPPGWAWTTVEQLGQPDEQTVLTGPFGSSLGREDFVEQGVPLLTIGCLTEQGITLDHAFCISEGKAQQLARYRLREGDLLFSRSASVGRAGIVTASLNDAVINYHLMRLRLSSDLIDPKLFVHYVHGSETVTRYIRDVNHGATRDGINTSDLLRMPVLVPPRNEQARIVAEIDKQFSRLDAGVAALKRVEANLRRYKASVLKAACEGRLTAAWRAAHPDVEPASELLKRILRDRRRRWEEAELAKMVARGKSPKDDRWKTRYEEPLTPQIAQLPSLPPLWTWATLDQLLALGEYGTSVKCDYAASGIPVLRIPNIINHRIDLGDLKRASGSVENWPDGRLIPGDVLICRTNGSVDLIGKTAVVPPDFEGEYAFASYLIRLRFVMNVRLPWFVHFVLASSWGRRFITQNAASSAGQHNLSLSKLARFACPLPPGEELEILVRAVEEGLSIVDAGLGALRLSQQRAARLRQSVLRDAFEGKLAEQDPHDEAASVLLERIRASQQQGAPRPREKRPSGRRGVQRTAPAWRSGERS